MTNLFDGREKAFEKKFAQDEETAFKILNTRNKLFGLYVAERLGLSGSAAEDYAKGQVMAFLDHRSDEKLAQQAERDLAQTKEAEKAPALEATLKAMEEKAREKVLGTLGD
jgi:hypothetical protein